jgi:hypothetical protein
MPIDRKKYHPKWSLISQLIRLRRANNNCEVCGLMNYSVGFWDKKKWYDPQHSQFPVDNLTTFKAAKAWATAYNDEIGELYDPNTRKVCVVILTVSHLDHDVKNNHFWNLKAMCQCCHLSHDRKDNAQRRKYGRTGRHYNQLKISL